MEDIDPLKNMLDQLAAMKAKLEASRKRAQSESGGAVFMGALATAAFLADWTFCGGIGTILALGSGVDFLHHNSQARRLRKSVDKLEVIVTQIQTARALDPQLQKKLEEKSAKPAFDEAAQKRILELEAQLKDLQQKTDIYFSDSKVFKKDNNPKKDGGRDLPPPKQ